MNSVRSAFCGLIVQAAILPQSQPASLSGTVVSAATGKPIARAAIKLVSAAGTYSAMTTGEGKFVLQVPFSLSMRLRHSGHVITCSVSYAVDDSPLAIS